MDLKYVLTLGEESREYILSKLKEFNDATPRSLLYPVCQDRSGNPWR